MRFDFISSYLWIFNALPLVNLLTFLAGLGDGGWCPESGGLYEVPGTAFTMDKFMKRLMEQERTPGERTCRPSCGWSHTSLLHLSNCSWQGNQRLRD